MSNQTQDFYQKITDRVIEKLDQGQIMWHKTWNVSKDETIPYNLLTKKYYNGVNVFILLDAMIEGEYSRNIWLTFNQAKQLGGHVKKGETSTEICRADFYLRKATDTDLPSEIKDGKVKQFFLKTYKVFNVGQCEGLILPNYEEITNTDYDPVKEAEAIINSYRGKPKLNINGHSNPCYIHALDEVQMPMIKNFTDKEEYYCSMFHELGHSTGAKKRLNRPDLVAMVPKQSHAYSREELTAELSACLLLSMCGLDTPKTLDNSINYLAHWAKALRKDKNLFPRACKQATESVNWILNKRSN